MKIQIVYPDGRTSQRLELFPGWNRLDGLGIKLYDGTGLVLWNSLPGAGVRRIARIVIDFDNRVDILPCYGWRSEVVRSSGVRGLLSRGRTRLTIGTGSEVIPPRAGLRVRWGFPKSAPRTVKYGDRSVTWHASQAQDIATTFRDALTRRRDVGMWPVYGERYPSPPGAYDRNGVSGWEQDPVGMCLRSDMLMNRTPLGAHDEQGNPEWVLNKGETYNLVRGWGVNTQLAAYRDAYGSPLVNDSYPECRYEKIILGLDRWNGYLPYDGQHLGMVTGCVRAAAQCGDPIAQDDLRVLAWDAKMSVPMTIGSRENAWTMDAMYHARETNLEARSIAQAAVTRQMPNGGYMRASYPFPFSPNPWDLYGTPASHDVEQLMERDLTTYALGLFDGTHNASITKALLGRPWPSTNKFVEVGEAGKSAYQQYQRPTGPGDYYPWLSLGVAAQLGLSVPWKEWALMQPTPEGARCDTLVELRDRLSREYLGREQTAMLLAKLWEIT